MKKVLLSLDRFSRRSEWPKPRVPRGITARRGFGDLPWWPLAPAPVPLPVRRSPRRAMR
jgi:hypothetical protein